jgi:high-affinity iron transporter
MLSTFLIALREGLEAALIVGILLAYLKKTERVHMIRALWGGVAGAILASLALGAALTFTSHELGPRGEPIFAGITSLIAVGFVTVMVFWMKSAARGMRDELHGRVDKHSFSVVALSSAVFFAVAREGLETALFVYTNFGVAGGSLGPSIGLILGFAAAITLGYLLYKRSLQFDLGRFFKLTGIALVVVAAGVLSHGIAEFQELGWLPGASMHAWNIESWLKEDSFVGSLLSGSIGFTTTTSWLQVGVWVFYLTSVLTPYLKNGTLRKGAIAN